MQRKVGESNYVELCARYAARGLFNHSHFFVELERLDREGDVRALTREHASFIQQRSAPAEYFRNPKNSKDINPLTWLDLGKWDTIRITKTMATTMMTTTIAEQAEGSLRGKE